MTNHSHHLVIMSHFNDICLVCWQSTNDFGHLVVCINSEALLFRYARELYILRIQLFFHSLLQCLEN